jgi:hypothetical protein
MRHRNGGWQHEKSELFFGNIRLICKAAGVPARLIFGFFMTS